jgi:hypothetical protein
LPGLLVPAHTMSLALKVFIPTPLGDDVSTHGIALSFKGKLKVVFGRWP